MISPFDGLKVVVAPPLKLHDNDKSADGAGDQDEWPDELAQLESASILVAAANPTTILMVPNICPVTNETLRIQELTLV